MPQRIVCCPKCSATLPVGMSSSILPETMEFCPSCLASGKKKGKIRNLENERFCHDGIALALALLPLLVWPFTVVTAPCAIYYSIRHWKSPGSILPRTKIRFILAILFALGQCALWIYFLAFLLYGNHHR